MALAGDLTSTRANSGSLQGLSGGGPASWLTIPAVRSGRLRLVQCTQGLWVGESEAYGGYPVAGV